MKKILLLMMVLISTASVFAQTPQFCEPQAKPRVLLVGDSWTKRMVIHDSFAQVFTENNRTDLAAIGEETSFNGITAAEWATAEKLALIDQQLAANPSIDIVQVLLGANDLLGGTIYNGWHANMTPEEETAFIAETGAHIRTVVDHIKSINSDLRVLVVFDDYMGLEEAIKVDPEGWISDIWRMVLGWLGNPSTERLNTAFVDLEDVVNQEVSGLYGVTTISCRGLMQQTYGFPADGIAPGDIQMPGDITRSTPSEALDYFGQDAFHLSPAGYLTLARYLWDSYYEANLCITQKEYSTAVSECAQNGGNPSVLNRWMQQFRCK